MGDLLLAQLVDNPIDAPIRIIRRVSSLPTDPATPTGHGYQGREKLCRQRAITRRYQRRVIPQHF